MSAWRIGTGGGSAVGTLDGEGGALGKFTDTVVKWIPGEIVAFYLAAITLISGPPPVAHPSVSLWLGAFAATALLILFAGLRMKRTRLDIVKRIGLGLLAFLVWSAVIPQSGWAAWTWAADNPRAMAVSSALAGIILAPLADLLVGGD